MWNWIFYLLRKVFKWASDPESPWGIWGILFWLLVNNLWNMWNCISSNFVHYHHNKHLCWNNCRMDTLLSLSDFLFIFCKIGTVGILPFCIIESQQYLLVPVFKVYIEKLPCVYECWQLCSSLAKTLWPSNKIIINHLGRKMSWPSDNPSQLLLPCYLFLSSIIRSIFK